MSNKSWLDLLPAPDPTMSKRSFITNITPLPANINRDTAVSLLHNHHEMIELNPLVIGHERTKAPSNATLEEQVNCIWYLITDTINYLPGGAAKSQVSYKAGFYDLPNGLQTHCFAPGGVDLKAIWLVGGNMPGEKPEPAELGVAKPSEGLYIREDVEVRCNVFLSNFVKRNLKKAHGVLVERLLSKYSEPGPHQPKPRPAFFASSPTESARSMRPISLRDDSPAAPSLISLNIPGPTSRNSSYATPSPSHLPSPYAEPCSCGAGGHEVMCPNYRYGAPAPKKQFQTSVITAQPAPRPSLDTRWPPRADAVPEDTDGSYSPAGAHPEADCDCRNGEHVFSCQYYATSRTTQVPHAATINLPIQQQVKDNSHGRVVWKLPPGSNPSVAYRSPQLFGEQAELPGSTTTSVRDEDWDAIKVPELDSTELAYWKMGIVGDLKMAPGDAGWL